MAYTYKHGDRPLDGYTIQRAVGRGGFGEVYYALTDSGKQVAVKYLRENADVELRGISMVMNLKSPHLITIYDVKQDANREPFVIMEYVSGPSLRDLMLAEPNGLGVQKSAFFMSGIAKGLSYLHDRGIVHRDLKPGNIFYDDGYVKIGDYGLSKHISVSNHSGQTVSVGTVHYMAPEIGSGSYTKAIDIYALGVILFEMLTGRLPFAGSSMGEILMRHLSENPDLNGIPEPFRRVIARALAKDPKERYQDVNEMVDAIMESVDVSQGMSSFDPNSLAQFTRAEGGDDPDRTLTRTPHRLPPIPSLDLRNAGAGGLGDRIQTRADEIGRRFREKAVKWEQRLTARFPGRQPVALPPEMAGPPRSRISQFVILLAITVAVGAAMGTIGGPGGREFQAAMTVILLVAGGTIGSLVAHLGLLQRSLTRHTIVDRLTVAGLGGLFMLPGLAAADTVGHHFEGLIVPALVVLALCDWGRRIEAGRRGKVEGGEAFWPGLLGLMACGALNVGRDNGFMAAGICATMSLITQAAAAMWPPPMDDRLKPAPAGGPRPQGTGGKKPLTGIIGIAIGRRPNATKVMGWTFGAKQSDPPLRSLESTKTPWTPQSPVAAPVRVIFAVLSTLAGITALGCFFALVSARPSTDVRAGLMFGTLAGISWLTFLGRKATQRFKQPVWRGTVRWLLVSSGLCLASGMITLLATEHMDGDERAGAVFGLVAGGVIAAVCALVRGSGPASSGQVNGATVVLPAVPVGPSPEQATAEAAFAADAPQYADAVVDAEPDPRFERSSARQGFGASVIDASAPSFVGRTANAGLSAVGKLLLLSGLAVAVTYSTGPFTIHSRTSDITIHGGEVHVVSPKHNYDEAYNIPRTAVLAPMLGGALLLLVARRHDGGLHFLRGAVGVIFGVAGVLFALGPAAAAQIPIFLRGDWHDITDVGPLAATAGLFGCALLALFWPKRRGTTIVI